MEAHAHPSRSRNHYVSMPQVLVPIELLVTAEIAALSGARPWVMCSQVAMPFIHMRTPTTLKRSIFNKTVQCWAVFGLEVMKSPGRAEGYRRLATILHAISVRWN